jgi:serine protease Do
MKKERGKIMKMKLNRISTRILFPVRGGAKLFVLLIAGVTVAGGSALAVSHFSGKELKGNGTGMNVAVDERPVLRAAAPYSSFAPVVKKVAPAVVKIVTTGTIKQTAMQEWPGSNDQMWRRFFGNQFGQVWPPNPPALRREHGLGSGVIITKDGYILTNNHVVDSADRVQVTLTDGREFTAKVIGRDPKSDVAVVKIDGKDLPTVPVADSDKVQVGDVVLAVGNPMGIGQTVTTGIVSATGRGNLGLGDYEDFIQTDAAINPGNSGGALVDAEGRLIGINTAIFSRSGGNQGIGFAIPSDLAHNVMDSLVKYGHVTRGYLGVMIQDVTPALAKEFKLTESKGALVGDVLPKGPADKAGLKDGDVVVQFNGKNVTDSRHLKLMVAEAKPGSSVPVKILREGASKTIDVTVKQLPGTEQLASSEPSNNGESGTLNGVGVESLNRQSRQQFQVPDKIKGAVVTEVRPDSPAAEAGLQPGDVIEEINRHPIANADQAVRLTENAKDKHTLLRIWRDGGSHYLVVDENDTKTG